MKKFENLPFDVQETIKGYLKAFNKVDVYYENGEYHFGVVIKSHYAPDHQFIGEYYAEDIYSPEERILNYVNEFHLSFLSKSLLVESICVLCIFNNK